MIYRTHIRSLEAEFFPFLQGKTILQKVSAGTGSISFQTADTVFQLLSVQCSGHDPGQTALPVSAKCRPGQQVSARRIRLVGTVHEIEVLPLFFRQGSFHIFPQFLRQISGTFLSALDLFQAAAVLGILHAHCREQLPHRIDQVGRSYALSFTVYLGIGQIQLF